jgi:hypothetical protein
MVTNKEGVRMLSTKPSRTSLPTEIEQEALLRDFLQPPTVDLVGMCIADLCKYHQEFLELRSVIEVEVARQVRFIFFEGEGILGVDRILSAATRAAVRDVINRELAALVQEATAETVPWIWDIFRAPRTLVGCELETKDHFRNLARQLLNEHTEP